MKWQMIIRTLGIVTLSLFGLQGCYTTFGSLQTATATTKAVFPDTNEQTVQETPEYSDTLYVEESEYDDYGDDSYRTIINNIYINNPTWRPYFDPFWDDPFFWSDARISVWVGISYWDSYWWDPYYYPPVVIVSPWRHRWPAWGWWGYPTIVYYDPWYSPWYWDPYYSGWGWYWGGETHRNFKRRDWERRHPVVERGGRDLVPARGNTGIRQPRVPGHSEPQVRQRTVHRRQIQVKNNENHQGKKRTKIIRRGNRTRYTNDHSSSSNRPSRQIIRRTRTYRQEDNHSRRSRGDSQRVIRRRGHSQYQDANRSAQGRQENQRTIRRQRTSGDDRSSQHYRSRSNSSTSRSGYRSNGRTTTYQRKSYRSRSASSQNSRTSYRSRSSAPSSGHSSSYRSSRSRSDDHSRSSHQSRSHRSRRR